MTTWSSYRSALVLIRDLKARFPLQALLCTETTHEPAQTAGWFVRRWNIQVTFQEMRAHLGVKTRAAVVQQGDCPLNVLPTPPDLDRHAAGCTAPGQPTATHAGRRAVTQTAAGLRRRARHGTLGDVAGEDFGNITAPTRPNESPLPIACTLGLFALSRFLNKLSRVKTLYKHGLV